MSASQKKYKKAVIFGAAGFVGINLAHALAAQGLELICFDQVSSSEWPKNAKVITGDFSSVPDELIEILDQAYIFHLISSCRPSLTTMHAADEISTDLVSTIRYLESTKNRDVRWIFISSGGTVYGQQDIHSIVESCSTKPICSYGLVKLSIEGYFELYKKLHHLDYVTIRLGNPYGPWQDPQRGQGIVSALIYKALSKQAIEIWGDGSNVRDYIYISDATNGILNAAFSGESGEIYNLGSGSGKSIVELIDTIAASLNLEIPVKHTTSRSVDVRRNVLNSQKLAEQTGWKIQVDLHTGINLTAAWIKEIS
ncbi:MAG: NAD-dependent epimerase/dehydratase family protein [Undibacterium sp.]|jgi:UDP-glucose 4-epimerase|nr:NAD-dependent epimerase/dehydratase family protein [Undibacterium sp.]